MTPYDFQYICIWIAYRLRQVASFFDIGGLGDLDG